MNCVCIVFEVGDKMLTLSSMENLIVPCNQVSDASCFIKISLVVPGKMSFYHIWTWEPYRSCDQHYVDEFEFPCTSLH